MRLWVGLGNPEPSQARHRHNVGFMAVDAITARHGFSPWRQKFRGLLAEGSVGGERVLALKPLTYMNDSGESARAATAFHKIEPGAVVVFHDELDLAFGRIRVKRGGGAAGHNGLRSLDRHLGGPEYWRVRIGIGHPGAKAQVTGHVLGDFAVAERPLLTALVDAIADSAGLLAADRPEDFMTRAALLLQDVR